MDRNEAAYAVGVTLDEPFMLNLTIYNADTITPDDMESRIPGMVESLRFEHQRLLRLAGQRRQGDCQGS